MARALTQRKIPYMVIGGHAVLIYGEPRLTQDIDITLGVDASKLDLIKDLAAAIGLEILVKDPNTFVKDTMVLPLKDKKSGIRIDLIFSNSAYEKEALKNVKRISIGGLKVSYASLEDLVIHKLIAGRPRDMEDIQGILLKNPHYDAIYIKRWIKEFDRSLHEGYGQRFNKITQGLKDK